MPESEQPRGEEGLRDALHREKLSRALGLAQSIAQAPPYPLSTDGVRDVAGEIVSLLSAALDAGEHHSEDEQRIAEAAKGLSERRSGG